MSTKKPGAPVAAAPRKRGKLKIVLIAGTGAMLLIGGGVGAGVYASRILSLGGPPEDPNRPKLVQRSGSSEPVAGAEGGENKEPAPKIGTVPVTSDSVTVDPRKFEVTYVPLDQPFTANLANGGIIQVGLSFATYYDIMSSRISRGRRYPSAQLP